MDGLMLILAAPLAALVVFNGYVSYRVYRSELFEPAQKYMQYALVWMAPLAGGILAYALAREPVAATRGEGQSAQMLDGIHHDRGNGINFGSHHTGD